MLKTKTFQHCPLRQAEMYTMIATAVVSASGDVNVNYHFPYLFKAVDAFQHKHYIDAIYVDLKEWADKNDYNLFDY